MFTVCTRMERSDTVYHPDSILGGTGDQVGPPSSVASCRSGSHFTLSRDEPGGLPVTRCWPVRTVRGRVSCEESTSQKNRGSSDTYPIIKQRCRYNQPSFPMGERAQSACDSELNFCVSIPEFLSTVHTPMSHPIHTARQLRSSQHQMIGLC